MTLQKYGRYWAVYQDSTLLCVTVYKKGALAVMKALEAINATFPSPSTFPY